MYIYIGYDGPNLEKNTDIYINICKFISLSLNKITYIFINICKFLSLSLSLNKITDTYTNQPLHLFSFSSSFPCIKKIINNFK